MPAMQAHRMRQTTPRTTLSTESEPTALPSVLVMSVAPGAAVTEGGIDVAVALGAVGVGGDVVIDTNGGR